MTPSEANNIRGSVEDFLMENFIGIFELNAMLESISWVQYYDSGLFIADVENFIFNEKEYSLDRESQLSLQNEIKEIFEQLPLEDLELTFGSGVKIKITRDGIDTSPFNFRKDDA